ncbi:hypothetical protein QQS21_010020 [Conoideocrella luteorostrata]|uniref:Uncharacterized protein n=1 Tax=Conoideocrella luteorostrata TaxID=1105319 RepID=A0AAJ0CIH5_9HYPO|nr:hypothetical protein QQS21_010020 [Conoideocrella luteorostrata]
MFGGSRRRQPPVQPLTRETANPNAATAAAAVFMSRRDSNSSLSSAAAAAALRARPMTPTNVAEVQSKRVNRRSPSVSSLNGSVRGRRELTRTPSVGSMMERTFRTPSPGRSPAPREHVPPVPAMPSVDQIMASHQTNRWTKGSKGPVLQTQPFRTASQKVKDGQPSWFGGATTHDASPRTADAAINSTTYIPEPRPGSVSPSINFSYPRARALSPSPSVDDDQTLVYDPNSRRMVARDDLVSRSQSVREGSEKPKKKKKKPVGVDRTGSYLAKGTVGGRTKAAVLEEVVEPQPGPQVEPEIELEPTPTIAPSSDAVVERGDEGHKAKKKKKKKKKTKQQPVIQAEPLVQQQSVVEEQEAPGRTDLVEKTLVVEENPDQEHTEKLKGKQSAASSTDGAGAAAIASTTQLNPQSMSSTPNNKPQKQVHQTRVHSESPARSAHFGVPPGDQLAVKHEPPARSVSPRKSAMKLGSHARGVSPSDDGSEASGSRGLSPQDSEDTPLARKKSVRVSWDDRNTVVVGEAAQPQETDSPIIPSPQTKKPWHSVVSKFGKKENVSVAEDETMTPRPALPQFGSVREKKTKEPEERPLVRPSERIFSAGNSSATAGVGLSADNVIGATMLQDLASKNAANISKYREPLPTVLPSVEDKNKQNSGAETSDDDFDTDATTEPDDGNDQTVSAVSQQTASTAATASTNPNAAQSKVEEDVPTISVSQPSPRATGSLEASPPGSFPDGQDTSTEKSESDTESDSSGMSTPTRAVESPTIGAGMTDIAEEDEETENDRFSDAYEDLEEVDGDGFLSLDAVVDSPTACKVTKKQDLDKSVKTRPTTAVEEQKASQITADEQADALIPDDWENAKAYWKSLSIDKRRQLEIEALSENGEDESALKQPATIDSAVAPTPNTERSYQIRPGTKWSENDDNTETAKVAKRTSLVVNKPKALAADTATPKFRQSMRQSMRADPPAPARDTNLERPGGMRKSLRNGPAPCKTPTSRPHTADASAAISPSAVVPSAAPKLGMRQSLRTTRSNGDGLRPTLSSSGRPASYHQQVTAGLVKGHKRNMSSDDLASTSIIKPTLRRRDSDDSESSFKRKRSGSGDANHFRMSMRSSMREPPSPSDATKRFSLRSLSPPAFRRNSFSSLPPDAPASMAGGPGRMRQSLRDRPASSSSRLKVGSFKKPSGFSKKSKGASRFVDSSDEEEDGPSLFRSRFADSSDEDEPAPLPKSKGLPKSLRNGNGLASNVQSRTLGSPELPDDEGGPVQPKLGSTVNGQSTLRRSRSGRGTLEPLPQNDMPRPASRRGSFMSILRRKKDTSDKISKAFSESAARKDTDLERSPEELAQLRSNSVNKNNSSWPLADGEGTDAENGRAKEPSRPSTAGGAATSRKSSFLRRRSTSQGMVGLGHAEVDATEPVPPIPDSFTQPGSQQLHQAKKKKFGALRKMFGIHD